MLRKLLCLMAAALCFVGLGLPALAAQVDADSVYCFSAEDFSYRTEPLRGICITELPAASAGTVLLGTRIIRPGDILTAEQVSQMTFSPLQTRQDSTATVGYLPIYEDCVDPAAELTISIRGREDKAPTATDIQLETYKNISNDGQLQATDPEGKALTYSVTRQPRRGQVCVQADGRFTYTPNKNKAGVDSFTYTATDPAGNVSREATVTIQIQKPEQPANYADTEGLSCQFEAEWLKNTGLFAGNTLGGRAYFEPESAVTKGEFLALLTGLMGLSEQADGAYASLTDAAPRWLQPYLAAALRSGLIREEALDTFAHDAPITLAEAHALIQGALPDAAVATLCADAPATATPLTRADCAQLLYDLSH